LDCVSIFSRTVGLGSIALGVIAGVDGRDPLGRAWPPDAPRALWPSPTVAIPDEAFVASLDGSVRAQFEIAADHLEAIGVALRRIDIAPLLDVGALLYEGAFVAERYAAVGAFIDAHRDEVDPVVGSIIAAGRSITAERYAHDLAVVATARLAALALLDGVDALMLPTVGEHPTFDEVRADPKGVNARLGRYTTFCNLLDLAALAVPVPGASTFGITLFGPAFSDQVLADLAARFLSEPPPISLAPIAGTNLVVVGAHLSGEPLNSQLTERGARLVRPATTSAQYRLVALATDPPKPGLVRVGEREGAPIEVEVWELPPSRFGDFVAAIPPPLAIGQVELARGAMVAGFVLTATTVPEDVVDITEYGGWRAYLRSRRE
jgi:allophanate hydrolase